MTAFALDEILEATSGRLLCRGRETFTGISIDSRKIRNSELFIALRGAKFDGHDFLEEALRKGAGAVVTYPPNVPANGKTIIHVPNTLKALQDIARFRRVKRTVTVTGITGTNGKTSTKEMVCAIVGHSAAVLCSSGNLNNQIGLPLNLLRLDREGMCVLEMGASRQGDIRELCEIALPDYGIVTNVGPAHLEGFGSVEAVRDTKLELGAFVKTLVVNGDDRFLADAAKAFGRNGSTTVTTYGIQQDAPVMAKNVRVQRDAGASPAGIIFDLALDGSVAATVTLRVLGLFNVYNALAASALAHVLGIPAGIIREGLESFEGVPMRLQIQHLRGAVVISDMYNANPASMEEALKELVRIKGGRSIAVLGDMLELGSYAETAHRKLGSWLADLPVDVVIGVGPLMATTLGAFRAAANNERQVFGAADAEEARNILHAVIEEGDTVLIKGSRSMNLERVMEEH